VRASERAARVAVRGQLAHRGRRAVIIGPSVRGTRNAPATVPGSPLNTMAIPTGPTGWGPTPRFQRLQRGQKCLEGDVRNDGPGQFHSYTASYTHKQYRWRIAPDYFFCLQPESFRIICAGVEKREKLPVGYNILGSIETNPKIEYRGCFTLGETGLAWCHPPRERAPAARTAHLIGRREALLKLKRIELQGSSRSPIAATYASTAPGSPELSARTGAANPTSRMRSTG